MALDTTIGGASSDSYVTLVYADAYHAAMGGTTWTGVDALKEAALRRATAWMDGRYGPEWPGYRTNGRSQALDWPRYGVTDQEGWGVLSDAIPTEVQKATAEAALRELVTPGSLSPDYVAADQVKAESVGSISVTYTGIAGAAGSRPVLTVVAEILAPLIGSAGATTFLARA